MLSADDFIAAVEATGLLTGPELDHLRLLASQGEQPAALAASLVETGALTSDEASRFLVQSGDSSTQMSAADLLMPGSGSSVGSDSGSSVFESSIGHATPTGQKPVKENSGDESIVQYDEDYEQALNQTLHGDTKVPPGAGGKRRKHLKKAKGNEFDSPLILFGGGGLVLLVLCGVGLAFLLNQESGDDLLRSAQTSYESGAYTQAIAEYERFVEDFTTHADWSSARVKLSVAKLRQAIETSRDFAEGLRIAQQQLPEIEDEPAFREARGDLASLLPKIAMGLADQANAASQKAASQEEGDSDLIKQLVTQAEATLVLVGNTKYVPKSLRDQAKIDEIRELLVRIDRRRQANEDLTNTLTAMAEASSAGEARTAYEAHSALIHQRPEFADDPRLTEAITAAAAAERTAIQFTADRQPAATEDRPSPIVTSILAADLRLQGQCGATGVYVSIHDGVAYGVQASNGKPLWRRPLGASLSAIEPTPLDGGYLLIDHRHSELLLVNESDGQLRWRTPLEGPTNQPVVRGQRVLVAQENGRLLSIDSATGERLGSAEFAQRLRAAPTADKSAQRLYLTGEHSSLYTLDAATLECLSVYYLGHSPGSIVAQPVMAAGHLLVLENVGLDTCQLRLLSLNAEGEIQKEVHNRRLAGICNRPPLVAGRRVMVATNRGEATLLELTSDSDTEGGPVTVLATRPAGRQKLGPRYLASAADAFWIADIGLTRSVASLADNRLLVQRLNQPFTGDAFTSSIVVRDKVLLHSRRRRGKPGVTLAATDARSGDPVWEVDLAARPLGGPMISSKPRGLLVTTTTGQLHRIGRDATRRGVSDRPAARAGGRNLYDSSTALTDGARVLTQNGKDEFLTVRLTATRPTRTAKLPGVLACRPASMGSGWLAPLEIGQVLLVDARGRGIATPFQPPLAPGRKVHWRAPAVAEVGGETVAVIADDVDAVYCLALGEGEAGKASLDQRASHRLAGVQPTTAVAIAAGHAAIGVSGGKVVLLGLPALENPTLVEVGGEITWGPHAAGAALLVATENQEMVAIDAAAGQVVWRTPLEGGNPLGLPLGDANGVMVALDRGTIVRYDATTGEATARLDLGQPLGSGPTVYGKRLLISAADATVLVLKKP